MQFAYNMDFDQGIQHFNRLTSNHPESPHGYLFKTVSYYYLYLTDMENAESEKVFKDLANETISLSSKKLRADPDNLDALFCMGTAHIYLAAFYGENDSWIRAYWYGKEGINYLKRVIALNPAYHDAYLGLGLYHYYADVMPRFVKAISSLLGVEANREKGLQQLHKAYQNGRFTSVEAGFFLGYIYLYLEKKHTKSLPFLEYVGKRFPDNPIFQIVLGDVYRRLGRHQKAVDAYELSISDSNQERFPKLMCSSHYLLGNIYFERNEIELALAAYTAAADKAAELNSKKDGIFSWATYKKGQCLELLGKGDLAKKCYVAVKKNENEFAYNKARSALKNPMSKLDTDLIRAKNMVITRSYNEAIQLYNNILPRLARGNRDYPLKKLPEIFYYIGKTRFEMKNYSQAIKEFKKVIALGPPKRSWVKPWTHFRLGKCYVSIGRKSLATSEFKRAYRYNDSDLRFEIDKINRSLKASF